MRKQQKIGYALVVLCVLLTVGGSVGLTLTGDVEGIPTPNVPDRTFYADEPLPENGLSTFISARLTLTWDRDDIYVVIVDENEKQRCESTSPILSNPGTSNACTAYDPDVLALGQNGEEGLSWDIISGTHYAGIGKADQPLPAGTEVNMAYEVNLHAGFASYFLFALLGVAGFAYSRVE